MRCLEFLADPKLRDCFGRWTIFILQSFIRLTSSDFRYQRYEWRLPPLVYPDVSPQCNCFHSFQPSIARLQGGLIDTSGTMSGGGGKVASGGMRCGGAESEMVM